MFTMWQSINNVAQGYFAYNNNMVSIILKSLLHRNANLIVESTPCEEWSSLNYI